MMDATTPQYPARLDFDGPLEVARWRPLVNWLLAIPQFFVAQALQTLRQVMVFISLFTILFTKQIPRGIFDAIVMTHRYEWRVMSYALWLREKYPPFDFRPGTQDDGSDPASVSIDYPTELGRWMPLVKWFLAIPHYFVLVFLGIAAIFVVVFSLFAVLFTGAYPAGMRRFVVGISRWSLRVRSYVALLTDRYPPFSFE